MTRAAKSNADVIEALRAHPPLYVSDDDLHSIVAPHVGRDTFIATIRALEHRGFPAKSRQFRGRYYPAVRAWLDANHGLGKSEAAGMAEDGEENWNGPEKRRSRPQMAD